MRSRFTDSPWRHLEPLSCSVPGRSRSMGRVERHRGCGPWNSSFAFWLPGEGACLGHVGGSSLRGWKLVWATRAMAKGLDADVDCSFEAPDLFLARPGTSTSGSGDDIDCWGHIRMHALAGFRGRNDLARVDRRAGRADAMAGDDRRFLLHPRSIRCLDNPADRIHRRQIPAPESDRKHALASPPLL